MESHTNNFKSDEYVEPKVVKEKEKQIEDYYKKRETYRADYQRYKETFRYYLKNIETGKVYTNLKEETTKGNLSKKDSLFVTKTIVSRDDAIYGAHKFDEPVDSLIPTVAGTFEGQVSVPASLSSSNFIMDAYENYRQNQMILLFFSLTGLFAFIGCLLFFKKSQVIPASAEKWRPYYNKIPIDIRTIFFIIAIIGACTAIIGVSSQVIYVYQSTYDLVETLVWLIAASYLSVLLLIQWVYIKSEIKDWPNLKKQWKKAFFIKVFKRMRGLLQKSRVGLTTAFLNQSTGTQLFILLGSVFCLGLAAMMIVIHPIFVVLYLLLLAAIGIPLLIILVNRIGYFNQIVEKTNAMAAGKLGDNLPLTGKSVLAVLAGNINLLKQGVKTSQNEQAKSERLKTELITNVSHDLRTPLTSIITYTELLKIEGLSKDEKTAYLEIIDRKSKRLKVLIDDLFEVSKMASGNIELKKEKVDLVQLLQQALGEYDDTINASNLQFRVTKSDKPVYSFVDGQKLWRVFDNLIGNILKYSLEHSRVFITISSANDQAVITFKNISKYELSENSEELFERFKRGDTSRHTEGSGLGLAIAQSIVDLHDGRLEIETDGDLFKVNISLKLME
ncbi:sensor histidine kinase, partial [Neobacillus jeddahensis]|uniref:sensor histidine kinase n=1 Tax=Neobacillus jeddahensis TaxID=1461580 RepID=UPI00058E4448